MDDPKFKKDIGIPQNSYVGYKLPDYYNLMHSNNKKHISKDNIKTSI